MDGGRVNGVVVIVRNPKSPWPAESDQEDEKKGKDKEEDTNLGRSVVQDRDQGKEDTGGCPAEQPSSSAGPIATSTVTTAATPTASRGEEGMENQNYQGQ